MFNRLLIFHRKSVPFISMKTAALPLLVFAAAWIFTACNQKPASGMKASSTTELSQGQSQQVSQSPQPSDHLRTAIEQVADKAIPAVVHIEVKEHQEMANPFYAYKDNPFFRRFFGLPKDMPKKLQRELIGIGTGVIIDAQGHILSNYHVVGGATKIEVTLSDGTQYPATVVGVDPETDLGVIKINADKPLPFLTFANSDDVKVGQWVVAVGEPRGLDQTVTQGIISAKHRTGITSPGSYQDFLQTDAAINPGNSGGPLLTLDDRVVGINSMIASESGGFEGIGFAIPSNMADHVAKALIAHGKVERGWVGVGAQDLTSNLAKSFGLAAPKGALIAQVKKGGPADKAGLKKGDVVISYQDRQVADASDFRNDVANSTIGQQVKLGVWRNDKKQEISVTIGNLAVARKAVAAKLKSRLGVVVRPLTVKEAEDYGLSLPKGVAVQWVDPNGPMGKAGFKVGDVILAIDGHPIQGVDSFDEMMTEIPQHQKVVLLAINHKSGQSGYVQFEIS
ncbi:MAG: Do family serine endopeptidase [Deltaproteobacteria bacterium]